MITKGFENYQRSLVEAVERWLDANHAWITKTEKVPLSIYESGKTMLQVGNPPAPKSKPLSAKSREARKFARRIGRKFNLKDRDKRNHILGRAGEEYAFKRECDILMQAERKDLACKVRWVSEEDGDGAGYDISSFDVCGNERLLEVKTTNGGERTPFYISSNEVDVADEKGSAWFLFRLWDFSHEPKAFELQAPLNRYVSLVPTNYQADF